MATKISASTPATKQAIRDISIGSTTLTVGPVGEATFQTVKAALTAVQALPVMADEITVTCSSLEANGSSSLDKRFIKADTGNPFSAFAVGQQVGVEIGGSGCPILGVVLDDVIAGDLKILLKNPILTDLSATSCVIGTPLYKSVMVQPNHIEVNPSATDVPSFTTIEAVSRGTTRIEVTAGVAIFQVPGTSNEVRFLKLGLSCRNTSAVRMISFASLNYQADCYIQDVDGYSASQDGIYVAPSPAQGGLHIINSNLQSGFDTIRLGAHREVTIRGCILDSFSHYAAAYNLSTAIAIGATSLVATPVETYNIMDNTLRSFGQDIGGPGVAPVHGTVQCVDIRNRINSNAVVNVMGNSIYASGDDAVPVVGINATGSASGETPTINSLNNVFDIRNNGAGGALTMNSAQANYTISRNGNVEVNGTTGANTAAATTV